MRNVLSITGAVALAFAFSACSSQEEMAPKPAATAPAAKSATAKAPETKTKTTKATGDVGLLDSEKNYIILVTKDGKLVTLDFDAKTKVTQFTPRSAKIAEVGLGSSATVSYTTKGEKNIATQVEYTVKKGE